MASRRWHFSFVKVMGSGLARTARGLTYLFGRTIGTRAAAHAAAELAPIVTVQTPRGDLHFHCNSAYGAKRALKFLAHEPETRSWIDTYIRAGDHLWDVGANMGAYTLYACLKEDVIVTAFEPMPATFAMLARNIEANRLTRRVIPMSLSLSNSNGVLPFYLSSREAGSAMHALGSPHNVKGRFEAVYALNVIAARGDTLVRQFGIPMPDHIKIDVDGHELPVLEGISGILPNVRTILIEMTGKADASGENGRIRRFFERAGYVESSVSETGRNRLFVNRAQQFVARRATAAA